MYMKEEHMKYIKTLNESKMKLKMNGRSLVGINASEINFTTLFV